MAENGRDEVAKLQLLLAAHPEGTVYALLADAHRRAGQLERAWDVLEKALRRHGDHAGVQVALGRVLLDQGRPEQAAGAFRRAVELEPTNRLALRTLGELALARGVGDEAVRWYRALIELDPGDAEAAARLAELDGPGGAPAVRAAAPPAPGAVPPGDEPGAEAEGVPIVSGAGELGEVITETIAELYADQGFYDRAAAVYRALLERAADDRFRDRLAELEALAVSEPAAAAGAADAAPEPGEPAGAAPAAGAPEGAEPGGEAAEPAPPPAGAGEPVGIDFWTPAGGEAPAAEPGPPEVPWHAVVEQERKRQRDRILEELREPLPTRGGGEAAQRRRRRGRGSAEPDGGEPAGEGGIPEPAGRDPAGGDAGGEAGEAAAAGARGEDAAAKPSVALVDMLVGLLEYGDPYFRGGSSLTRLLAVEIGRELGLSGEALSDLAVAALLRDLGRLALGPRFVPAEAESAGEEKRRHIERHVDVTLRLLEGLPVPAAVRDAIRHHHERWDGSGYPGGLRGHAIPLPARILALADTVSAMLSPRPYRPPVRIAAAVAVLEREAGQRHDPDVLAALKAVLARPAPAGPAFALRHHVLVVDPLDADAAPLAVRLGTHGYLAETAPDLAAARARLLRLPGQALILADRSGTGDVDGFLAELRASPRSVAVPAIVVHVDDEPRRVRLLEAGADACFPPGAGVDELCAALAALLRRAASPGPGAAGRWYPLRGDLGDFPLAWLLQVMRYETGTAAIALHTAESNGIVYVEDGEPYHARLGELLGEAAVERMLAWRDGTFAILPDATTATRTVSGSVMDLLLAASAEDDGEPDILGAVRA